jgi:hypothetical protein
VSDNYEDFLFKQSRRLLGHPELCRDSASNRDFFCDLIQTHFNGLGALADIDHSISDAELKSRIHNIFERWQASHLLLQISQAKARGDDYCTDSTKVFPDLQAAVLAEQTSSKAGICKDLTAAQCSRAFAIIRSWEVDFEWTIAQQEAGAKFGASVCHPGASKQLNARCLEKR